MSNNIESKDTTIAKKSSLNPKAIAILVISWIMAIVLIIIGIVSLTPSNAITLEEDRKKSYTVEEYETYVFEFQPENSGYYIIMINGANLSEIKSDNGNVAFTSSNDNSGYEKNYKIYLSSSEDYEIKVTTYGIKMDIIITL